VTLVAEIEEQRVMIPNVKSWMQWRAVCYSHPSHPDDHVAPWMATDLHDDWIDAKFDALQHDIEEHPMPKPVVSFDSLIHGTLSVSEPLLHNARRTRHSA
jgi:hypothetical protein